MNKIDKQIQKAKTICCKGEYIRAGRAKYLCSECNSDVTIELVFLYMALDEDYQNGTKEKKVYRNGGLRQEKSE